MMQAPLVAETRVKLADPLAMAHNLCARFVEHGTVTRTAAGGIIESVFGRAELRAEHGHLHLRAEGADASALYVVRNALVEHLAHFAGDDLPDFTWSGERPLTIPFFHEMHVIAARHLTPRMRRITLAGSDVAAFEIGPGFHARLLIPPAGRTPVWPTPAPDGRTLWPKGEDALIRRVYTVRSVDRAAGTIDIDMVLHEEADAHPAPGSAWAAGARPGDPVGVMGPGGGLPPEADWYVLAGDETALPVIARIAERLPSGRHVTAVIEVADETEQQPIVSAAELDIIWLHRHGAPAGSTERLAQALRALGWPAGGRGHVLVGCEHRAARTIRTLLTGERGLTKKDINVAAYWRLGRGGDAAAEGQDAE